MTDKPGKVIGLKVEHSNPEEMAKTLAISLGESLTNEASKKQDAAEYARLANELDMRANKTKELLDQIRRRDAGEVVTTNSRMDPLLTYSAFSVEQQYAEERRRAKEFRAKSQDFLEEAAEYNKKTNIVQQKLMDLR